jgi:hypothetical protein
LFQYAFAWQLSQHLQQQLKLDISFYERHSGSGQITKRAFDLPSFFDGLEYAAQRESDKIIQPPFALPFYRVAAKFGMNIHPNFLYEKKQFCFQDTSAFTRKNAYVEGYWQHWKYLEQRQEAFRRNMNLEIPVKLQSYVNPHGATIALHVRRGDYLHHPTHPTLTADYYKQAFKTLEVEIAVGAKLLVFSDDILWCQQELPLKHFFKSIEFVKEGTATEQFKLMCSCNHFIIANSTFSWWAALLSVAKGKKVVAPSHWINYPTFNAHSFYPPSWQVI